MKAGIVILAVTVVILSVCESALAVDIRAGNTITYSATEKVTDDILTAGNQVTIDTNVPGDITAAGNSVMVSGSTTDSVILSGNIVTASGPIGNDAWIAGGTVSLDSPVTDNAYIAGGTVTTGKGSRIGKDLLIAGRSVNILGTVGRNLQVAGGNVKIGGTVNGDVKASVGEGVELQKGALIRGDLIYSSPTRVKIDPGARVLGEQRYTPTEKKPKTGGAGGRFALWFGGLIAAILFGVVLLLLFPARTIAAAATVTTAFLPSLGVGILVLVATPVAILLIAVTIFGIPVTLALLAVYLILLYAAKIYAALAVGSYVLGRAGRPNASPYWSMILGLVILAFLELIPFIGGLVWFIVLIAGLGAFLISWWRDRDRSTAQPVPPSEPISQPQV